MLDRVALRRELVDAGLERIADPLVELAQPCIVIETEPCSEAIMEIGESKFGGNPDVPAGFQWPTWQDQPLAFLGQINLAALAGHMGSELLPKRGILSFFYDREQATWGFDPKDRGSWRVFYFEDQTLARTAPPSPVPASADYAPCILAFADAVTTPSYESLYIESLHLSDIERDRYSDWELRQRTPRHQILGHPQEVQGEMQTECQLASNGIYCGNPEGYKNSLVPELIKAAGRWRLLLQLDSDDHVKWMWGDVGCLYFWITEGDLAARRFDNVWMILQCS